MLDNHYDVICTDLDGTLLDDQQRHYHCYLAILEKYGGVPVSADQYWNEKRHGKNRKELLVESQFGGTYEDYMQCWKDWIEEDTFLLYETLKPGVIPALRILRSKTDRFLLVTMRQKKTQLLKQLRHLELDIFFDEIIAGNPFVRKKSSLVSFPPSTKCLVIGDTEADEELANQLDADFLAVTSGLRDPSFFQSPDYTVSDWSSDFTICRNSS